MSPNVQSLRLPNSGSDSPPIGSRTNFFLPSSNLIRPERPQPFQVLPEVWMNDYNCFPMLEYHRSANSPFLWRVAHGFGSPGQQLRGSHHPHRGSGVGQRTAVELKEPQLGSLIGSSYSCSQGSATAPRYVKGTDQSSCRI